jgi:hypothetical protein
VMRADQRVLIFAIVPLLAFGSYLKAQSNPITINLTPSSVSLKAGESVAFNASVSGTNVPGVMWSLVTPVGTLANGLYTAPSTITSPQAITVLARSVADPSQAASATVWLITTIGIAITPSSTSLQAGQSAQFNASVAGALNTSVSWSLTPSIGTVNNGTYTAPMLVDKVQTVLLTAVSLADPGRTAQASIMLEPSAPVAASPSAVIPAKVTLQASQTQQFTTTMGGGTGSVQWSISPNVGSVTSSGQYTAPNPISQEQSVTLTATAMSNSTLTASSTIKLAAVSPTSSPIPQPPLPTPQSYNAISDTVPRAEGPAPVLGPANSVFIDPDFGTRILRVSDQNSFPGDPNVDVIQGGGWQTTGFYRECSGEKSRGMREHRAPEHSR